MKWFEIIFFYYFKRLYEGLIFGKEYLFFIIIYVSLKMYM